jgi:two-component system, cell cycle response regulator
MTNLFMGAGGEIYYSSLSILVMTLIFIVSIRLLINRKKRAYLTMTICTAFMLLGQLIVLFCGVRGAEAGNGLTLVRNLFDTVTFILANMSIYQLYGETTKRLTRTVYVLIAVAALLSFIPLAIDIYAIVLIGLCFLVVNPLMEQGVKYQVGVGMYAAAGVAHIINNHVFDPSIAYLQLLDNLFRIGFYMFLFLILFDRVMELMENIYNKSTRDALTGLYNRFYFFTTVSFMVSEHRFISVIFLDIDNFKKLNDTRGHEEGDKALKAVASILKEEAEEAGVAGRYGGEELVMMVEDPKIDMVELSEKIRYRIEDETIVTASIGYATYEEGITTDQLIKNADKGMYAAKKSGKNRVVAFTDIRDMETICE